MPTPQAPDKKPWERTEEESEKAYGAFFVYFTMEPERRSLAKTREQLGKPPGYLRTLEEWSSRYHWRDRTLAYDDHQYQEVLRKQEKDRRDMIERHAKQATVLQGLANKKIQEIMKQYAYYEEQQRLKAEGKPYDKEARSPNISVGDILRLLEVGMKQERLAKGEPTEITETKKQVVEIVHVDEEGDPL